MHFLLFTTPGLKVSKSIANSILSSQGITLTGNISGNIEDLTLDGLTIKNDAIELNISQIHLKWSLLEFIFDHKLMVESLEAQKVHINIPNSPDSASSNNDITNNDAPFIMPFDLDAKNLTVHQVDYLMDGDHIISADNIQIARSQIINDKLTLHMIKANVINYGQVELTEGYIFLNDPFTTKLSLNVTTEKLPFHLYHQPVEISGDFGKVFTINSEGKLDYDKKNHPYKFVSTFQAGHIQTALSLEKYAQIKLNFLFSDKIDWQASIQSLNKDIDGTLNIGGNIDSSDNKTAINSQFCDIYLANTQLKCNIDFSSSGQALFLKAFSISNPNNKDHISLSLASDSTHLNAKWTLFIDKLSTYVTNATGNINSTGNIHFIEQVLNNFHINTQVHDFNYHSIELDNADIQTKDKSILVSLSANNTTLKSDIVIDKLTYNLAELTLNQLSINEPLSSELWQLNKQSKISIGPQNYFSISNACLENGKNDYICLKANLHANNTSILSEGSITPGLFLPNTPISQGSFKVDYKFNYSQVGSQPATGSFTLNGHGQLINFSDKLSKSLYLKSPVEKALDISKVSLNAKLENNLLSTHLKSTLPHNQLQANATIKNFNVLDLSPALLSGQLIIHADKFGWLTSLFPEFPVQVNSGALNAHLTFADKLLSPKVAGEVHLTDGSFDLLPLNTQIDQLYANLIISPPFSAKLQLNAKIKDKPLTAEGEIRYQNAQFQTQIHIKGNDLLLLNTPETELSASPDLTFTQSDQSYLKGSINIDKLNVNLAELKSTALQNTIQNDVVYINSENQAISEQKTAPFNMNLMVDFGKDSHLSGLGINTKIQGKVNVISQPNKPVLGVGVLQPVDGIFSAYGKHFTISSDSSISFNNSNINNPLLDIKANYSIPTSVQLTQSDAPSEIGINITGTANDPKISLFSEPTLSQTDILSYILFGRALDKDQTQQSSSSVSQAALLLALNEGGSGVINELKERLSLAEFSLGSFNDTTTNNTTSNSSANSGQNNTAVFIGKQLTDRLYISYGVGVFTGEQQGIATFALTPNWKLKGDVTSLDTGADILYQTHSND